MITIDLQDDDANQTKKANRLQEEKGRRRHQQGLDDADANLKDQLKPQSESGLLTRLLKALKKKE